MLKVTLPSAEMADYVHDPVARMAAVLVAAAMACAGCGRSAEEPAARPAARVTLDSDVQACDQLGSVGEKMWCWSAAYKDEYRRRSP